MFVCSACTGATRGHISNENRVLFSLLRKSTVAWSIAAYPEQSFEKGVWHVAHVVLETMCMLVGAKHSGCFNKSLMYPHAAAVGTLWGMDRNLLSLIYLLSQYSVDAADIHVP